MFDFDLPRTDLDAETAGRWRTYRGKIKFKIARINNPEYLDATAEASSIFKDAATEDEKAELAAVIWSRTVLKDWAGVNDTSGVAIPYSPDAGAALLSNKEYKDIATFILQQARSAASNWEVETEELGND